MLDPFCGCGTTSDAAEKLGRQWIGIDITALAISLIKNRLLDTYGSRLKFVTATGTASSPSPHAEREERGGERRRDPSGPKGTPLPGPLPASQGEGNAARAARGVHAASTFELHDASKRAEARTPEGRAGSPLPAAERGESPDGAHGVKCPTESLVRIIGEPTTPNEAATLAEQDKFQFQWWALGLVGARLVEQKKSADHGIDGKIFFRDDPRAAKPEQIIFQVKAGKAGVDHVRDLRGMLDREKAAMGVLITLQPPTKPMEVEAASLGFYEHKLNGQKYPRLQLRTVKELMEGRGVERPSGAASVDDTFKKAPASRKKHGQQTELSI